MIDQMTKEIADRFARLDEINQMVALATLCALAGGASSEDAIKAGNAILVAHGRKPIDPADMLAESVDDVQLDISITAKGYDTLREMEATQ